MDETTLYKTLQPALPADADAMRAAARHRLTTAIAAEVTPGGQSRASHARTGNGRLGTWSFTQKSLALAGGAAVIAAAAVTLPTLASGGPHARNAAGSLTLTPKGVTSAKAATSAKRIDIVTTSWTVRQNADSTVTLAMAKVLSDPSGLRAALRAAGINAYVNSGCATDVQDLAPYSVQVAAITPSAPVQLVSTATFTIRPSAIPSGDSLFVNFQETGRSGVIGLPAILTASACQS